MSKQIQVIRGMHDTLPVDIPVWNQLEDCYRNLAESYGYRQIRTPIVEKTSLFKRSIGEVTDIVEKEMYSFDDRNGDSLSLRPENTAAIVRSGLQNGMFNDQHHRLWYCGPMFRHERPQKGRYRQFYQLGAEAFGMSGPGIEAELILVAARFWAQLGLEGIALQINSLGSHQCRQTYRNVLVEYFTDQKSLLDEDSLRRLGSNPLRILDSKNSEMHALIEAAPRLKDHLSDESAEHFSELREILDHCNIQYEINPRLVRGLDYYCHTVFEWVTDSLGAQGTVCAGGRYDGLIEQLGGKANFGAGFAMGCERLISMIVDQGLANQQKNCDVFVMMRGKGSPEIGYKLAESLRNSNGDIAITINPEGGSLKSQFRKADRSGARIALILAEDEIDKEQIGIKFLREDKPQVSIEQIQLNSYMQQYFSQ
ncbi:MAG: histidyl-tRNA synthetase [Gammaproteobacteria bacterium]|jgi:histidyl-tRNA synthetase